MSLRRIALRDFVIVSELEIELGAGFTVLTGETGAGKSILVDALQLALGERAEAALIREGASRAEVCAEFDAVPVLVDWLGEAGFDAAASLLLRRTIDQQGRSRAWINGSPATAGQLRQLGDQLLDIHGQHAWQSLTRPDSVRALLDAYAGVQTRDMLGAWQAWRELQQSLDQARATQDVQQRELERLQWQIAELSKLAPGEDEWEGLNSEHTRLAHAQSLLDAAQAALEQLDAEEAGGALAALAQARQSLVAQQHLEPQFRALNEIIDSSLAGAQDAVHALRLYLRKNEPDPQRLAELDERVGIWVSLARRYRRSPEDLYTLLQSWKLELAALQSSADLPGLEAQVAAAGQVFRRHAEQVSSLRHKAAPRLAEAITQAMQGLGMAGGRFEVALEPGGQATAHGLENVSFLVSGHASSTARPVSKIASGGELSRIALAIAVTTSQLGSAQTLIFDEVDAGIGGAVAEVVGRLMKQLGRDRQVLAVTHLPQVASCADQHLLVTKVAVAGGVASQVEAVAGEQRVAEIARMLGGERLSGTSLAHAKEMLGQ